MKPAAEKPKPDLIAKVVEHEKAEARPTHAYDPNAIAKLIAPKAPPASGAGAEFEPGGDAAGPAAPRRAAHVRIDGLGARRMADRELPELLVASSGHARGRRLRRGNQGGLQSRRFAFRATDSIEPANRPSLEGARGKRHARRTEMRSAACSTRICAVFRGVEDRDDPLRSARHAGMTAHGDDFREAHT